MKKLLFLLIIASISCSHKPKPDFGAGTSAKPEELQTCFSSREYVVTYKYLSGNAEKLGLAQKEVESISDDVSKGCTGAAKGFVTTFELLNKVGLGGRAALETSVDLAKKSPVHSQIFAEVFKKAYLQKHLDLDMKTSYELAHYMTFEYQGDVKTAYDDFEKLTQFCTNSKELNLPLALCARIAANVSKAGEKFPKGIATAFIESFHYLNNKGPLKLNVKESLNMAKEIVVNSPDATENFKVALEFAMSEKGLKLPAIKAAEFAHALAKRTLALEKADKGLRLPANQKQ